MAQKKAYEVDSFLQRPSSSFPVVLIYGQDRGLVSERCKRFAAHTKIALDDPFCTIFIDARELEASPSHLLDEAQTLSLFGNKRLIWVKNAAGQKALLETIKSFLKTPPQDCYILLEANDLPKNSALRRTCENAPHTIMALPCFHDNEKSLTALIETIARQFHLKIQPEAKNYLLNHLGGDHLASRMEIEKLCLYCLHKKTITLADVQAVVSDVSTALLDHLIEAILLGKVEAFSRAFDQHMGARTPLSMIMYSVQRDFERLQQLRLLLEKEQTSPARIVQSARPPLFFRQQKIMESALSLWSVPRIHKALEQLQNALLESRKNFNLQEAIIRQNLLYLTLQARPS